MTLPAPEATHRWQGRTLVGHHGEPLGRIEIVYLDKATNQPEWALLETGATGPARTFVPLVSAGEEGDTVRVPFDKTLVEGAPSMPAERELSEEQEGELYRHYGGAAEPPAAADEPLPTGGGGLSEASVPEPAPIPASAVAPAPGRVDAPVSEASVTNDGLVATRQLRVTDPRFAAGAAAVALAVGIWRRETIGRQVSTAVGRLGAVPATVSRRRRRRRRTKALNQAVTGAAQQTAALARAMAGLVSGTALLPVRVTVKGGRRARAGVQVTRKAISQGARRVRPGRRRKRRGGTLGMAAGGAAGYVLGAKAGSSGGQPITVVPETPTVTPSSLTVVPPADLAPMPAEPTVLPGEDASAAEERQRPPPPDPLP